MSLSLGIAFGVTFLVVGAFGFCIALLFDLEVLGGLSVILLFIGTVEGLLVFLTYLWRWAL